MSQKSKGLAVSEQNAVVIASPLKLDNLLIDARASIHPTAKIGNHVQIGPWAVIGADVEIGDHCTIGPHAVIEGPTQIGHHNHIYQFASIGAAPQDKKYNGEETWLKIGNHNTIREFVTINRGTIQGGGVTQIGDYNWIMAYVHVAHDCILGNHTTFANYAALAGHVIVEDYVTLAGFAAIHQFCRIGQHSFIARATYVTQDILPYMLVAGYEATARGLNLEGLRRRDFSAETLNELRKAYKIIFRQGLTVEQAIETLQSSAEIYPPIRYLIDALQQSTRGIVR